MDGFFQPDTPDRALAAEFAPLGAAHDRDGSFPFDTLARLHQEQLLGLTVPHDYGGGGAGLLRCVSLVGTIGEGCASTALVLAMQLIHQKSIVLNPHWPEELRARVGRDAAENGALINALRVEPSQGSPSRGGLPETTARRVSGGWSLTGRKIYSTGSPGLTWFLVWTRTDEAEPRLGTVLVPAGAPGVEIVETWDQLGLRASGSHDVVFHDVVVPADHAVDLRLPSAWGRPDPIQAAWNNLMLAALYTGVATAARDWVGGFLRDRVPSNLGASLATLPRMQEAVGGIEALLTTNRRLLTSAAADFDRGHGPSVIECNLLKNVAAENAITAVQEAVKLTGNHGLSRANPLERHLRDVLCARIHTPQADAAHVAAGRAILGI
jgi:alkylation response protein AidB-like acyl-CoA dehydrogenase